MKKTVMAICFVFITLSFTYCREQPTETKTVVVEKKTDEPEGALERTAKKVDDKVNKEIDQQIDKIDDN